MSLKTKCFHLCPIAVALAAALSLMTPSPIQADMLSAPRTKSPLQIDGKLDEASWKDALVTSAFGYLKDNRPDRAPAPTVGRVLVDDDAVYFGIRCEEPEMAKLVAEPVPRDGALWNQDCVEVFLSPNGKPFSVYQFMVGASGAQFDRYMTEYGKLDGPPFNAVWQSAVSHDKDSWSAEIRIPLSVFAFTGSDQFSPEWLVNIARERKPVVELTSWAPVELAFAETPKFFRLAGMPLKTSALDLQIVSGQPSMESSNGNGSLKLQLSTSARAAGEYRVQVKDEASGKVLQSGPITIAAGDSSVEIGNIKFPGLGKNTFQIVLRNAAGQTIAGTYLTSDLVYAPLQVKVSEPFYANCIFPDEQIKQITGAVSVKAPPQELAGAVLQVELKNAANRAVSTKKINLRTGQANVPFALEAATLAVGDYTLAVQLLNKAGQSFAAANTGIRKLAKPAGSSVRIDRNLNLVVNGTPVFAHTWMSGTGFLVSKTIREGIVHPDPHVNLWNGQVSSEPARLDPADVGRMTQEVMPSEKVLEGFRRRYEENKDRKDAWFYYLADEPEGSGMSLVYLKNCYDSIKKMDPYHPVQIVSHSPQDYVTVCDIVTPDSYINPLVIDGKRSLGTPMQVVRDDILRSFAASPGGKTVWVMPQAFNYAGPLAGRLDSDFPNFTEFSCVVYTAIANGAKGVMPFYYGEQFSSWDMRYGVNFIFESLARLEPMLVAPQQPMPLKVQAPGNGVDVWAKNVDGKVLFIATNTHDKEVTATVTGDGLKNFSRLEGFREDVSVPVSKGELTLKFAPYQVYLLTSEKMDSGLSSVADLRAKIAAAVLASRKPGNILYGRGKEIVWTASDDYIVTTSLWNLTDGITDNLGWQNVRGGSPDTIEMAFPTFTPRFRRARVYSSTVQDFEFYIWKAGEWQKAGEVRGAKGPAIDIDFGKELSTVKIKIVMTNVLPGERAELTEVELYNTP